MNQLAHIRDNITRALDGAQNPVCLWSGGKESTLLLALIREQKNIPVIWFHDSLTPWQREFPEKLIIEWNLTALNYPPADVYFVPSDDGVSLVSEYSIGGQHLPTIRDFMHSDQCSLDVSPKRLKEYEYPYDVTFVGTRKDDEHFVTGKNPIPKDFQCGPTRITAPLRELTESEIWGLILELNVPYDAIRYLDAPGRDASVVHACTKCVSSTGKVFCPKEQREIESFVWDKAAALGAFRKRFNYTAALPA